MKKLLALLLCAVMMIAVVPAVAADDDFRLVVDDAVQCDAGDTDVEVAVWIENNPGWFAMQIRKEFPAELVYNGTDPANSLIKITDAYNADTDTFGPNLVVESLQQTTTRPKKDTDYSSDGDIFYMYFNIPADCPDGDYAVSFTVLSANNYALQYLTDDIVVVAGNIRVGAGGTPTPAGYDVADYKGTETDPAAWTAPAEAGKKFAGWFTDDTLTTVFDGTSGSATPKFVDEKVMNVYAQASTTDNSVRFVSTIDDCLEYESIGFKVECHDQGNNWTIVKELNNVYTTVKVSGTDTNAATISGSDDSEYITFCKLTGIPDGLTDCQITVTAFWKTPDGTTVWGTARDFYISCDSGIASVI